MTALMSGDGPRPPGVQTGQAGSEGGAGAALHHPGHGQCSDGGGGNFFFVF